jgi:hypothetical protein
VKVCSDSTQSDTLFQIKADRIIDFNDNYQILDASENEVGRVGRQGRKSLWSTTQTAKP